MGFQDTFRRENRPIADSGSCLTKRSFDETVASAGSEGAWFLVYATAWIGPTPGTSRDTSLGQAMHVGELKAAGAGQVGL